MTKSHIEAPGIYSSTLKETRIDGTLLNPLQYIYIYNKIKEQTK
jgi:hypothetical protein